MQEEFTNKILDARIKRDKTVNFIFKFIFYIIILISLCIVLYLYLNNTPSKNIDKEVGHELDVERIQETEKSATVKTLNGEAKPIENEIKPLEHELDVERVQEIEKEVAVKTLSNETESIANKSLSNGEINKINSKEKDFSQEDKVELTIKNNSFDLKSECIKNQIISDNCTEENLFIKTLDLYTNELHPIMEKKNSDKFFKNKYSSSILLKDEAVENFGLGNFELAYKKINQAITISKEILKQLDQIFLFNFHKSQESFDIGDYKSAKKYSDLALLIDSKNPKLVHLIKRIKVLEKVQNLEKDLIIAQKENNLSEEIILLEKILRLDNNYKNYQEKLKTLNKKVKDENYNFAISQGFKSLENSDLEQTIKYLNTALNIYPKGTEAIDLLNKIKEEEKNIKFLLIIQITESLVEKDEWEQALEYFIKAKNLNENSLIAQEGIEKSNSIIDIKNEILALLKQPIKLSQSKVNNYALEIMERSNSFRKDSKSLRELQTKLETMIKRANSTREVNIVSDELTDVIVKGVGKVGKVLNKTINLKPGEYYLEGRRVGYKTKLLKINILMDQKSINIEVICDEPI